MDWFYGHYARTTADVQDWRLSPLLAPDVSGVAPALVYLAGFDPLHDEGLAYAAKLAPTLGKDKILLVNLSGRGDKDMHTVAEKSGIQF